VVNRGEVDVEAEFSKAAKELSSESGFVTAMEIVGAEVLVRQASFEHVVDGGKDGCSDGEESFSRAPAGFEAEELSNWINFTGLSRTRLTSSSTALD
jgi:hypothetical protein